MGIIVKKFGGTSVANEESRKFVYKKIIEEKEKGNDLVVVISAMGRSGDTYATDTLLDLVRLNNPNTNPRELDQIFVCGENISGVVIASNLQLQGYKAIYLSGLQAGIITENNHQDARIIRIEATKINQLLEDGYIVVVGGGQGGTTDGDITTLGRGGSDTSACALGVALNAAGIEIYTDVEGIFTTDPRLVKNASIIEEMSYEDCIELAYQGAKVMHPRAVEAAQKNPNIPLYVRSTFLDSIGTLICSKDKINSQGDQNSMGVPIGVTLLDKQQIIKTDNSSIVDNSKFEWNMFNDYDTNKLIIGTDDLNGSKIISEIESLAIKCDHIDKLSKITLVGTDLRKDVLELSLSKLEENSIVPVASKVDGNSISIWIDQDHRVDGLKAVHSLILENNNQINESLVEVV